MKIHGAICTGASDVVVNWLDQFRIVGKLTEDITMYIIFGLHTALAKAQEDSEAVEVSCCRLCTTSFDVYDFV